MTYKILVDGTQHPLHGQDIELFPIGHDEQNQGKWIRDDENGLRWGFKHPASGEIVHLHPAGVGPKPNVGRVSSIFTVVEKKRVQSEALLTAASAEMGKPELLAYNPEDVLIVTFPPDEEDSSEEE